MRMNCKDAVKIITEEDLCDLRNKNPIKWLELMSHMNPETGNCEKCRKIFSKKVSGANIS
jgi:hypothetical protein